jgi:hypothetical protein
MADEDRLVVCRHLDVARNARRSDPFGLRRLRLRLGPRDGRGQARDARQEQDAASGACDRFPVLHAMLPSETEPLERAGSSLVGTDIQPRAIRRDTAGARCERRTSDREVT